jgi:tRNA(adenine34) deaminase
MDPEAHPSFLSPPDERFMREALREAERAGEAGEVPVGCVIVHEGRVTARAHNQREQLNDPTAHAEMLALTQAAAEAGDWRLEGATLYVTLEPCTMCAGAIVLARVKRLVFGAFDPKAGACGSLYEIVTDPRLNHRVEVTGGILAAPCGEILQAFFRGRRGRGGGAPAGESGPTDKNRPV